MKKKTPIFGQSILNGFVSFMSKVVDFFPMSKSFWWTPLCFAVRLFSLSNPVLDKKFCIQPIEISCLSSSNIFSFMSYMEIFCFLKSIILFIIFLGVVNFLGPFFISGKKSILFVNAKFLIKCKPGY